MCSDAHDEMRSQSEDEAEDEADDDAVERCSGSIDTAGAAAPGVELLKDMTQTRYYKRTRK